MRPPRLVKPSPKPAMTLARGGGSTRPVEILLRGGVFSYWRSGAVGCVDKWVFIPSCEGVFQVRYLPTLAHFVRIAFVILLLALAVVSVACGSQSDPTATPVTSAITATSAPSPTAQPWTPVPTWTPEPTWTSEPTATPPPTYTPAPTYTPVSLPTAMPYPTATPYPTPTTRIVGTPIATPTPFYGEWATLRDEIDPLTRRRQVFVALNEQDGELFFMGIRWVMAIACDGNTVHLGVGWASGINSPTVSFRIGDQPVKTEEWNIFEGSPSIAGERAIVMIRDLFNAEEFVIQVKPENLDAVTAVFSPAGLYWAVKPVLKACEMEVD